MVVWSRGVVGSTGAVGLWGLAMKVQFHHGDVRGSAFGRGPGGGLLAPANSNAVAKCLRLF